MFLVALGLAAEEQGPIPRAIIGGQPAAVEDYPFVVCVQSRNNRCCTGSIIAPNWVLTAAHCFSNAEMNITKTEIEHGYGSSYGWTKRTSKRIILHPQYTIDKLAIHNDVALVEVSQAFPEAYVAPLGIPTRAAEQRQAVSGTSATLLGYGRMENDLPSDGMRSVNIRLYHAEDCVAQSSGFSRVVDEDTLCAGTSTKRSNRGDSGGPLIVSYTGDGNLKYLQIGVTSLFAQTRSTAGSTATVVFARVSSFASWIKSTTENAVSPIDEKGGATTILTQDASQMLNKLTQTQARILSLQGTVRSLQRDRDKIKGLISQIKGVDGQAKSLQTKTDSFLRSASTILEE